MFSRNCAIRNGDQYMMRPMQFKVDSKMFEMFPGLRLAGAVATGVDCAREHPDLSKAWHEAWTSALDANKYGDRQSHPRIKPWRDAWKRIGVSSKKFPCSIEALLKRALKGGDPFSINPIVDFYNTISLEHVVPAGAFDLAATAQGISLRLTKPGDTFQALDQQDPEPIAEDETAYTTGSTVLTRHFVWKQSREALVHPTTRDVFLVSEILGDLPDDVASAVRTDFRDGLQSYFGVESKSFILDSDNPSGNW